MTMAQPNETVVSLPFLSARRVEIKDAARVALQGACAAASFYALMSALGLGEKFVGILSAALVLDSTKGSTLTRARGRFLSTLVGSAIGVTTMMALPFGVGTAFALALSVGAMHAIAALRPDWRYGVVAAIALSLGSEQDALATAGARALSIGIGVVVGSIASFAIWPEKSEARAERYLRAALRETGNRLREAAQRVHGSQDDDDANSARNEYHHCITQARDAIDNVHFNKSEQLAEKKNAIERLYNSVLMLDRVAFQRDDSTEDVIGQVEDDLDDVVETAHELIGQLIDDEGCEEDGFQKLQGYLDTIESRFRRRGPGAITDGKGLMFALSELRRSVVQLCDCRC